MKESAGVVFSVHLRKLRVLRGMTQGDMARVLNITRSCIANYESGKRQPDPEMIRKIADYFDVSADFLLGRSSIMQPTLNCDAMQRMQQIERVLEKNDRLDLQDAEPTVKLALISFYRYLTMMQ